MKLPHSTILNPAAGRASPLTGRGTNGPKPLQEIAGFGSNPGALRAWTHVPHGLPAGAPLVVVLHGCTQNAADYDTGAGWSQLADEQGFAVLYPEQQRNNNPNLCFNWFSPIDSRRDSGEALSVRQMIAWMVETHEIDEQRVFVTGLSAGGAMTSIMLAVYPEVFAGGAVIAGLPFGAVASVGDAFARMAGQGYPAEAELAALVRDASAHDGPWPSVSVWHGSADTTVHPSNSDRIIAQWRKLHGVDAEFSEVEQSGAHIRRIWRNRAAEVVLEQNIITGMTHGTPLKTQGADACGQAGPYMLEVGVSSSRAITQFWGLAGTGQARSMAAAGAKPAASASLAVAIPQVAKNVFRRVTAGAAQKGASSPAKGVGAVIEEALRAAGLMK